MSQRWYTGSGDGPAQAREAMEGFVEVYAKHGPVLRALADAATDDPEVERVYGGLVQSFIDVTTHHIEAEIEAGRVMPLDAERDRARARVDDGALPEPLARPRPARRRARPSPRRSRRSGRACSTARPDAPSTRSARPLKRSCRHRGRRRRRPECGQDGGRPRRRRHHPRPLDPAPAPARRHLRRPRPHPLLHRRGARGRCFSRRHRRRRRADPRRRGAQARYRARCSRA